MNAEVSLDCFLEYMRDAEESESMESCRKLAEDFVSEYGMPPGQTLDSIAEMMQAASEGN